MVLFGCLWEMKIIELEYLVFVDHVRVIVSEMQVPLSVCILI